MLGDRVYTFDLETSFGNAYNNLRWLLLMSLDKVAKEKDQLRDWNSQLQCHRTREYRGVP